LRYVGPYKLFCYDGPNVRRLEAYSRPTRTVTKISVHVSYLRFLQPKFTNVRSESVSLILANANNKKTIGN